MNLRTICPLKSLAWFLVMGAAGCEPSNTRFASSPPSASPDDVDAAERDATADALPDSAVPEPDVHEPDVPEPDVPEPEAPASEPDAGMADDPDDVWATSWATWHPGRVHANLKHDGRFGDLFLTVDGQRLANFDPEDGGAPNQAFLQGDPFMLDAHLAMDERPDVVEVVNTAGAVLTTIPVEDPAVLSVGDTCDNGSGRALCPEGSICALPYPICPDDVDRCNRPDGVCTEYAVQATETDEGLVVELVGVPRQNSIFIGAKRPARWLEPESIGDRVLYRGPHDGGAVDLYQNYQPVTLGLPIGMRQGRQDGEACDPLGVHDVCLDEGLCADTCGRPTPPVARDLQVYVMGDWFGFELTAEDVNHDLVVVELRLDDLFVARTTAHVSPPSWTNPYSGHIERDGDRYTAFGSSAPDPERRPAPGDTVCARVVDSTDGSDEICSVVSAEPPRQPVALGQRCDLLGLVRRCEDGTACSGTELDRQLICRAPTACTQVRRGIPALVLDTPLSTHDAGVGLYGEACDLQTATTGYYFEFTAPADGRYRFDSSAADEHFTLRSSCGLVHAVVACTDQDALEVDLTEGQVVTLTFSSSEASVAGEMTVDVLVTQQ